VIGFSVIKLISFLKNKQATMWKDRKKIELYDFERAGALQILHYLCENKAKGKIGISEIVKNVKATSETVNATIAFLTKNDLTKEEKSQAFPYQHWVWLTPKGEAAAQHLQPFLDALNLE
jgi:DNA-binding MarR family transcriptional regulator